MDKDDERTSVLQYEQQFHFVKRGPALFILVRLDARQIVCPHVRSATENSVVTSDSRCTPAVAAAAVVSAVTVVVARTRDQIALCVSLLRSPYNPPTALCAVKPACLHARA